MRATAKLFTHGRSQAVRLPREFRFEGRKVLITKVGDRVILEPLPPATMPWALIDGLDDSSFMPEGREQPEMPEGRVVFEPRSFFSRHSREGGNPSLHESGG